MLSKILAFFGFKKREKFKGQVTDVGINNDGEIIVLMVLSEGNVFHLKKHLADHDSALIFTTEPIEIGDENERD